LVAPALLAGCAALALDSGPAREEVAHLVRERSGRGVTPAFPSQDRRAVERRIRSLLTNGLTVDETVEVMLLQNRDLRALYTDLDVSQSDVVQATLLHNPVLDAVAGVPIGGGTADISFGVAMDVIDLLYVPLRRQVAAAMLERTKLRVAGEVLDFVWRTQIAYYRHQADEQMLEVRRQVGASTAASFELTRRLREAGNVTALALASEESIAEEAKLDVSAAEIDARESRERLNVLMAFSDPVASDWKTASSRLPDPPADALDLRRIEARASERSLDLAAAAQLVTAAGRVLGLDRADALFPETVVGGRSERKRSTWQLGPTLTLPIPLFDRGQARLARARAELERARELRQALAVRIRSAARSARDRVAGHRDRALHYRNVMLPVRERVLRETTLQYNAMQVGPLDVLRAEEQQITTAERYIEALTSYWTARADLGLVLAGRLPPGEPAPAPPALEQLPRFPFPAL
jgi:cobalt-zinc-cadmium efflux system outer membrane protein